MNFYDLRCCGLSVESADPRFDRGLDWLIGPFAAASLPDGLKAAQIICRVGQLPAFALSGENGTPYNVVGHDALLRAEIGGETHIWRPGNFACRFSANLAEVWLPENAGKADVQFGAVMAMDHAVRTGDAFLLHCACLDAPDGKNRILLHADSGTGKTTTAMALAEAGFALSGDDTAIVRAGPGGAEALGLPRSARVSRATLAMLPFLGAVTRKDAWDDNDEQEISRDAMARVFALSELGFKPVSAIINLARKPGQSLSIAPMPAADALSTILAAALWAGGDGMAAIDAGRFETIVSLFDSAPVYQMDLGSDFAAMVAAVRNMS